MNTLELEQLADLTSKNVFLGVWSIDQLKRFEFPQSSPAAIIVNLSPRGFVGTHWIALSFLPVKKELTFFDSFASNPKNYHEIYKFILRHTSEKKCYLLQNIIQDFSAKTCGIYCLFYIYYFARGLSLKQISSVFSFDTKKNEEIIRFWCASAF